MMALTAHGLSGCLPDNSAGWTDAAKPVVAAGSQKVPTTWRVVEALPRTASNKVRKGELVAALGAEPITAVPVVTAVSATEPSGDPVPGRRGGGPVQ